jgi:hypothetical protein
MFVATVVFQSFRRLGCEVSKRNGKAVEKVLPQLLVLGSSIRDPGCLPGQRAVLPSLRMLAMRGR